MRSKWTSTFAETVMTDHEFAKWLKDRGWTGKCHHLSTATYYHSNTVGVYLATSITDSSACTRRIYLNTDFITRIEKKGMRTCEN